MNRKPKLSKEVGGVKDKRLDGAGVSKMTWLGEEDRSDS